MSHQDIEIDYNTIDSIAGNISLDNQNRINLSHEVIGYLPYWEYEHYPEINYDLLTQINYYSADLDIYGNIINDHNWNYIDFIEFAQE